MDIKIIKNITERIVRCFKKDKGIIIPPGGSIGLEIVTAWRKDKSEVAIMTDKGPVILDGKNELFIRVAADNIDTIKLQVVPDFKNRVLTFIEVLDPNVKSSGKENKARIAFSGMKLIKETNISLIQHLELLDKDMEKLDKSLKRYKNMRNIVIVANATAFFVNLYGFVTKTETDIWRLANLFFVFVAIFIIYFYWNSYKKLSREYKKYQGLREEIFSTVKER